MSNKYLSGFELAKYMNHINEHELPQRGGVKDYSPDEFSWLQAKHLDAYYVQRNEVLAEERVTRQSALSRGEWLPNLERVEITKHTGTFWLRAGYYEEGRMLLYPEEALFLIDSGQLEVFFGGVALSLQQAFGTFLGPDITIDEYQVYAYLSRLGYIVRRHINFTDLSRKYTVTNYEKQLNLGQNKSGKRKRNRKCAQHSDQRDALGEEPKYKREKKGKPNDKIKTPGSQRKCDASLHTTSVGKKTSTSFENTVSEKGNSNDLEQTTKSTDSESFNCRVMGWDPWDFGHSSSDSLANIKNHSGIFDIEFPDISKKSLPVKDTCEQDPFPPVGMLLEEKLRKKYRNSAQPKVKSWKQYKSLSDDDVLKRSLGSILWNGPVTPLLKPQEALNTGTVLKKLKVVENVNLGETCGEPSMKDVGVQLLYDIFQPDNNFRKSDPGTPYARIFVTRSSDPAPDLIHMASVWQQSCDGVPVHVAVVDHGEINFSTFSGVDLPTDVTVG